MRANDQHDGHSLVLDSSHADDEPAHWTEMGRKARTHVLQVLENESLLRSLPLVIETMDPAHVYHALRPLVDELELSNLDLNALKHWLDGRLHFCTLTDAGHALGRARRGDVLVANLGTHERGLHWVGMYFVQDKSVAVFDSLNWHRPFPFHVKVNDSNDSKLLEQNRKAKVVGPRTFYNAIFQDLDIKAIATSHRFQTIHSGCCGMYSVLFGRYCRQRKNAVNDPAELIQGFVREHGLSPNNLLVNDLSILLAFMLEMETIGLAVREDGDPETSLLVPANRVDDSIAYAIVNDIEDLAAIKRQRRVDKHALSRGGAHFFSDVEELAGKAMQNHQTGH